MESELFGHEKGRLHGRGGTPRGLLRTGATWHVCCWTNWRKCRSARKRNCCACWKIPGPAARRKERNHRWMFASSPPPTRCWTMRCGRANLREDLFYRLNVFQITLPPLRQREGDLPVLGEALDSRSEQKHGCKVTEITCRTCSIRLRRYWPGNVRELRNVMERAVIIAGEGTITVGTTCRTTLESPLGRRRDRSTLSSPMPSARLSVPP